MSHTYALLPVSRATFTEIRQKLEDAGYGHAFTEDGHIDMHGIALELLPAIPVPPATIARQPATSSNIVSFGYFPPGGILEVEFTGGAVYRYAGVPPEVYEAFIASTSLGGYLASHIKPRYACTKLPVTEGKG